jgi:hypothetical protein
MPTMDDFSEQIETPPYHLALRAATIEKVFTDCVMDLKEILILDDIEILQNGFQVRILDPNGPLPEIFLKNSGDTFQDKDRFTNEVCKIIAIVRLRERMVHFLPGGKFMLPTNIDGRAIVGFQAKPMTWLGEGDNFLAAYHDLHMKVIG